MRQWNAINTWAWIPGKHAFKFGVDYRHIDSPILPSTLQLYPSFLGAADVLNNAATETSVLALSRATPIFEQFAAFAQDEWHASPFLTLSLGLRWELSLPPSGANGQDAYTISGDLSEPATLGLSPRGTSLWQTPWLNFAPRLGVAWQSRNRQGWETVLRSGGGVFFDSDNQVAGSGFSGAGFEAVTNYFGAPLPLSPQQINIPIGIAPPYGTLGAKRENARVPGCNRRSQ